MKQIKVHILFLFLMGGLVSCQKGGHNDISGTWVYKTINKDRIVKPFETFYPTSSPSRESFHDIVYIDSEKIDHPLMGMRNGFSIERKFTYYRLEADKIVFQRDSLEYEYDIQITGNDLCIGNGKFCLTKQDHEQGQIDSTIFKFGVKQEFGPNYEFWMNYHYLSPESICEIRYDNWADENDTDTIRLTKEEKSYILTMLQRIPDNQLDRIYNNGLSDCTEISIDFYGPNGWRGIETCGQKNENPFEIRVLTTNMFYILIDHLRKDEQRL
ncbi:MAG: hypothetical protein IPL46_03400 [Saprospiraceae bacterium]|nr:hypothetical protein [Saprospiraceae bacterium]